MKYIEGGGQGIKKVLSACKENGNPEPEFSYMSNGLLVTLRPKTYRNTDPDNIGLVLDQIDHTILSIMTANPSVSITEISSESDLSIRIVRYLIEKLRKKNVISREGSKKAGRWVVNV